MTSPVITWRGLILKSELPSMTRLLLHTMSCYMNAVGDNCFPSYATLARDMGCSPRAVMEHIPIAERFGFIEVQKRKTKKGKWSSNIYVPKWPPGSEPPSQPSEPGSQRIVRHAHTNLTLGTRNLNRKPVLQKSKSILCEQCNERPWNIHQQGLPPLCRECFALLETRSFEPQRLSHA